MDYDTRCIINRLTDTVLKVYDIKIPIVDMSQVVEIIGGEVIEDNSKSGIYDGRITRKYSENDNTEFKIFIPEEQLEERKRFTIAHELGHLFLHMGYKIDNDLWENQKCVDYYRDGNSEEEFQANEFAASLLMPKYEYKKIMNQYSDGEYVDISQIARYFGVSRQAALNRGKWLGYLVW